MRVLYIKANPKETKDSVSNLVGETFIERYRKANPEDEIDVLDLYKENWPHLDKEALDIYKSDSGLLQTTAIHFSNYDKYVFSTPMWNLGIPSILKAYFDYVVVSGITFRYNKWGIPLGLLRNKKAICIIARGGKYDYWPMSTFAFDKKYLKVILKFMGVKNIKFLTIENLNKDVNNFDKIVNIATEKANKLARFF